MIAVDYPEPHLKRTQEILKKYPEMTKLMGHTPLSAWIILGLVLFQTALAALLGHSSWWVVLLCSYFIGAFANHALWVMIHECTHNLVFRKTVPNILTQIVANLPIIFPSAISFRTYHIKHHLYQGEMDRDADLPRDFEVQWVGNSSLRKALWFLFYFYFQLVRVPYLKGIELVNRWVILNWVVELSFLAAMTYFAGWGALGYLALSSVFSIGLHPVGARWIQEHFVLFPNQETYSYYGPLNRIAFNVGYHNEHHDMMRVPWSRLPQIKAMAPEFYDTLYSHSSWSGLMIRFIFDPNLGLFSRVTRKREAGQVKKCP